MRRITLLIALSLFFVGCGSDGPGLISDNENNVNNQNNTGLKADGESCGDASECKSGSCYIGTCTSATCTDGTKNGDESDVDCGTLGCAKCDIGKACDEDLDCISGICNDAICRDMNCADGTKNGLETDVDCGGLCSPCEDGKACQEVSDCVSAVCKDDQCSTPTCDDGEKNGTETDIDCGGPCDPCSDGAGCAAGTDCNSGVCDGTTCAVPTCTDSATNASETDVDCGGSACPSCDDGKVCTRASDCVSQICDTATKTCAVPACDDNKENGDETDKDCGGSCFPCDPSKKCSAGTDCVSGICGPDNKCTRPVCDDGVKNGEETDVDCGGSQCSSCADNQVCAENEDCLSRVCTNGTCAQSQCSDGTKNGAETDVDCGGPTCSPCADGEACAGDNASCQSGVCGGSTCRAPTCRDTVKNGTESDVDCGGDCPNACADFKGCTFGSDCVSLVCHPVTKTCEPPRCDDGVQNATETDVDCGSSCPRSCQLGQSCVDGTDCATTICDGGPLSPICAACNERSTQLLNTRCGYANRGQVEQTCTNGIWVNTSCQGVWYGSCKEILADAPQSMDGNYTIDPDGPDPLYSDFQVFCDMSTSGGGWTQILVCTAKNDLRGELVGVDQAQTAAFEGCKPKTRDVGADGHTYHYSFDFPSGYSQFRMDAYELRANADQAAGHTSDIGFIQTSWNTAASSSVNRGDVSFGSAGGAGPVTSFSRMLGSRDCTDCTLQWPTNQPGPFNIGATSNKFRVGFGEAGPQSEGWYPWWDGAIYVR